jgi:hypothetical protein
MLCRTDSLTKLFYHSQKQEFSFEYVSLSIVIVYSCEHIK